jgi:hypothetical protein
MKTQISAIALAMIALAFGGCGSQGVTSEELMKAKGILWWDFVVPENSDASIFGLHFVSPGEKVMKYGGSGGWTSGERVRLFVFDLDREMLSYSFVGRNSHSRGRIPNRFFNLESSMSTSELGAVIKIGEPLVRKSLSDSKESNTEGDGIVELMLVLGAQEN